MRGAIGRSAYQPRARFLESGQVIRRRSRCTMRWLFRQFGTTPRKPACGLTSVAGYPQKNVAQTSTGDDGRTPEAVLGAEDIRGLASAGIFVIGVRSLLILLLGLGGNVALARLLLPSDFGLVAVGLTMMSFGRLLADGGIGVGLIRRAEPPQLEELRAVLGVQLLVTTGLAAAVGLITAPFGRIGTVSAVMMLALPFVALQAPGMIVLERSLHYRPLALVEVLQWLAYYVWALAMALAGLGVWSLASASVVQAVVAASVMFYVSPLGFVWPRLSWSRLRPLLGFGVRYQAVGLTHALRDQGLNVGTASIAGVPTLGLWVLARRIVDVPMLFFQSLWRVSFPAMSRLLAAGEDPRPLVERAVALAAVGTGLLLAPFVGSVPGFVPALFGSEWTPTSYVLPAASFGLLIGGPLSVATAGYLYAVGKSGVVLRSAVLHTLTWFVVTFPLLPAIGVAALGVGWLASSIVEGLVLGRATGKMIGARLRSALAVPVASAVVAGGCGWLLAAAAGRDLVSGLLGGASAAALYSCFLLLLSRETFLQMLALARRALREAFADSSIPLAPGAHNR